MSAGVYLCVAVSAALTLLQILVLHYRSQLGKARHFLRGLTTAPLGKEKNRIRAACPVLEIMDARPTGKVYISLDVLNVSARRNSFHAAKKLKSAVTATAGRESGRTTLVKT